MNMQDKKRPALLIIDMQNDFNDPNTMLFTRKIKTIIPLINQLSHRARKNKVPVIWINQEHRHQLVDLGREGDMGPGHCIEGTKGAELIDGLLRDKDDYTVIKRRYSGFFATDLDMLLRCLKVDTVVLTGIVTDGCVQATGMDAHARDYYLRVVSDATLGTSEEAHEAILQAMAGLQPSVVINVVEALGLLDEM